MLKLIELVQLEEPFLCTDRIFQHTICEQSLYRHFEGIHQLQIFLDRYQQANIGNYQEYGFNQ